MSSNDKVYSVIFIIVLLITGLNEARRSWRYYKYQEFTLPLGYRLSISIRKYFYGPSAAEQFKKEIEARSWIKLNSLAYAIIAPIIIVYLIYMVIMY